jgi:transposase InsO family protein
MAVPPAVVIRSKMAPMKSKSWCSPRQLVMLMFAGWINRHQEVVIAYQKEEIKVLREMLGGKRLRFTDEQRRRLALKAQALSTCTLKDLGPLVTPDTLCCWFRKYAGAKYDSSGQRRPGRPPKPQYIRDLVVRLAKENTSWGYTKIRDVIFTLGHQISRTTVRRILAEDGIEPAPERRKHMPWATFLKAHWGAIAAMDFFKVEVMTLTGPVRYSVLVVMDLQTRHVEVAGIVREAYERWMFQVLRNLTDALDGFLLGKTHLIMDRDPIFTAGFRAMLRHAGVNPVRLPRRSPNLNAFIERFIRSIKEECLDRVIPLGEAHLRELIREYMAHYHAERPHQGLGGTFIQPSTDHAADGRLVQRERLGGLLNYYYREAA